MITSAIAGVSDKDPDKEYLLAAYNEVSKNFHKSPAYQRLPNTPEDAKKRKTNNPNAHFPMMRTRMTIRMISCHGPRFRKLLMRLQH